MRRGIVIGLSVTLTATLVYAFAGGAWVLLMLAVGAAAILLVPRPQQLLLVAAFSLPFDSSNLVLNQLPGGLSMPKLIGVLLIAAVLYDAAFGRRQLRLFDDALDYAVVLFAVLVLISGVTGRYANASAVTRLLSLMVFYGCVKNLLRTTALLEQLLWAVALSGAVTAVFGIWVFSVAEGQAVRVGGFYMDPNDYAAAMVVVVAVSIHLALHYPRQRWALKSTSAFIGLLVATAIVVTGSRGGLLSLAIVCTIIVLRQPQRRRLLATAAVAVVLSVPLWPQAVKDRVASMVSSEIDSRPAREARFAARRRVSYVAFGLDRVAERPLTGHGYHAFAKLYADSQVVRYANPLRSFDRDRLAHNTYLEIAVGAGLPAAASYLLVLWIGLGRLRRERRTGTGVRVAAAGAFEVGLIGLAVSMLFLSIDAFKMTWLTLGVASALPAIRVGVERRASRREVQDDASDIPAAKRAAGVCMIISKSPPLGGGAEIVVEELSQALAARQIRMTVVSTRVPWERRPAKTTGGVARIWLPVPARKAARAAAFTVGGLIGIWHRRWSFDVLHAHQMFSQTTLGLLAGGLLGYPLIVNPHRGGAQGDVHKLLGKGRIGRLRLEIIRRRAAAFVAISEEIAGELKAVGVAAARIVRLPNPVDTERFRPATDIERADIRVELGLPMSEPLMIYAGRLDPLKGLDLLLDAVADLSGRLVIVGAGDEGAALEARASRELPGRVVFAGRRGDMERWFRAADVAVLPSFGEGLSVSLLEAMACGLPVVATTVGGTPDVVRDGETGILVPPGNVAALAAALHSLLSNSRERVRMGGRARTLVCDRFAAPLVAARYAELYTEVRARHASVAGR